MKTKFLNWWNPFYYGKPCNHGRYGTRYRKDKHWVSTCELCWREIEDSDDLDYYLEIIDSVFNH